MTPTSQSLLPTHEDLSKFVRGTWYESHEKLGAHPAVEDGEQGYHFCVWAPDASWVHVMGDFNDWDPDACPLSRTIFGGVWHAFVPGVEAGQLYKYVIYTRSGDLFYKADPYARLAEKVPGTASCTVEHSTHEWKDARWMGMRAARGHHRRPLNVFEVHLGSWRRHEGEDGEPSTPLSYDELAVELVAYVKRMGYTHVEILPVMEHPFDGSWGYQVTGFFAPTSRYGDPDGLRRLIDAFHAADIGVILDWVGGGFCTDEQGLVHFDGTRLFESRPHPTWGTLKFDYDRSEVRSFLVSSLLYWIEQFHADGIRMDNITSMLYLNFDVRDSYQRIYAADGSERDYAAERFLREATTAVHERFPDVMMIAEESSGWPRVTGAVADGGLGFDYKWDIGWMNDTLSYCTVPLDERGWHHGQLTHSLSYAFEEHFILPLSHDEVVHGKGSLLTRQPGDWWRQMAGLRALALWQMVHPGGMLNFMGSEIGQSLEWRYAEAIEYGLTEAIGPNASHQLFCAMLNRFYLTHPALWERDGDRDSFEWIDADNAGQSVISFIIHGTAPASDLVVCINFRAGAYERYRIGMPRSGVWREVLNTDEERFGGSGFTNGGAAFTSEDKGFHHRKDSVELRLPPLGGIVLAWSGELPPEIAAEQELRRAADRVRESDEPQLPLV